MKTFAICGVASLLAFLVAAYPMGLYDSAPPAPKPAPEVEEKKDTGGRFPEDLARSVRQQPVIQAAAFKAEAKTHKLAIFKPNGAIHSWQEDLPEEWQAETVAETELVVVILPHRKKLVSRHTFPNNAPPVERFQWEADAYIVEAKTGIVQSTRTFINMPRGLKSYESCELTAIGEPVTFRTVFNWVAAASRTGFPREDSTRPLVNIVD